MEWLGSAFMKGSLLGFCMVSQAARILVPLTQLLAASKPAKAVPTQGSH